MVLDELDEEVRSVDLATYEEQVLEEVRVRVHERLAAAAAAGAVPAELADPTTVADSMVAALPGAHPFDTVAGPFYDTPALVTWLGVTRQALHQRVRARQVLACRTADGHTVYPAWQLSPSGQSIPGLPEVLAVLVGAAADPWTVAIWLRTPSDDLGGLTAADWLAEGRDPAPVLEAARADSARWAA
jgi:hypothetical protein